MRNLAGLLAEQRTKYLFLVNMKFVSFYLYITLLLCDNFPLYFVIFFVIAIYIENEIIAVIILRKEPVTMFLIVFLIIM